MIPNPNPRLRVEFAATDDRPAFRAQVVAFNDDGEPLIVPVAPAMTSDNAVLGKLFLAQALCIPYVFVEVDAEPAPAFVSYLPGAADRIVEYTTSDGVTHRGAVLVWGVKADGSVCPLLPVDAHDAPTQTSALRFAPPVPVETTILRDPGTGDVAGSLRPEQA